MQFEFFFVIVVKSREEYKNFKNKRVKDYVFPYFWKTAREYASLLTNDTVV